MLSGHAYIDLTTVKPERMKARLYGLAGMPDGARVVVYVGALVPEPEAVWLIREHEPRLHVTVTGEVANVPRWLEAIRDGMGALSV